MPDDWDPFTPETAADARVEAVKAKFAGREPLLARAAKRAVSAHPDGGWVVHGDPKLGDAYPSYRVVLDGRKYRCTCHASAWGDTRSSRICSHVMATILHRSGTPGGAGVAGTGGSLSSRPPVSVESPTPPASSDAVPATPSSSSPSSSSSSVPNPLDPRFGPVLLPDWVKELRPHQWLAVTEAVALFRSGILVVIVDAPTGSGKTLIGELVRRELQMPAFYTCTTKTLQDQVLDDFPYAKVLKGRSNYPTLDFPDQFDMSYGYDRITCEDCTKGPGTPCDFCHDVDLCPYQLDKKALAAADLGVLNTAFLLAEANYVGRLTKEQRLIIADECDELEGSLMSFAEISIGPKDRKVMGLDMLDRKTADDDAGRGLAIWVEWLNGAVEAAKKQLATFPKKPRNPQQAKRRRKWERKVAKLEFVRDGVAAGGWIYDHSRPDWVTFKPIMVDGLAHDLLWRHAPKWLLMSATVISPDQMARELGLEDGQWAYVSVPSTFPAERRPIRVAPRANLTYKTKDVEWPKAARAIQGVFNLHPAERILVHTQSFAFNRYLFVNLAQRKERAVLTYEDAAGRTEAIDAFRKIDGAVLLAPSLQRGVSLDDEACRVVVVVKVPFASTGDPQVKKRLYYPTKREGQVWYSVATVRSLVQSTGRGMRHAGDSCTTYILDRQFLDFYRRNGRLFPKWWKAALDMHFDPRQLG